MTQTNQDVELWAGDTKQLVVTVTDDAGDPKDLTGATVRWILQGRPADSSPLLDKDNDAKGGVTIVDAAGGVFRVDLSPEDTEELSPRTYYHEAEVTDASGNISTVLIGSLVIHRSAA